MKLPFLDKVPNSSKTRHFIKFYVTECKNVPAKLYSLKKGNFGPRLHSLSTGRHQYRGGQPIITPGTKARGRQGGPSQVVLGTTLGQE